MSRRIAFSGSAGTGKTTLARRLADELDLPYVAEGMRRRLGAGLDVHGLGPEGWRALMEELWGEQRALEGQAGPGFIADRSSLDFAAFWLHYDLGLERSPTDAWMTRMAAEARRYDRIVLLPWGVLELEDDGVRSTNPWTQLRFQGILEGVLARFADPERLLRVPASITALDERVAWVAGRLD